MVFNFIGILVADGQQPMHLFLSSNNAKSLEQAKSLAENLLDTISVECGASRYLILYYHSLRCELGFFLPKVKNLENTLLFSIISSYHLEKTL